MNRHLILYLPILFLFISCSGKSSQQENHLCPYALLLISAPDSLKVVELNYNLPEDSLLARLEQELEENLCDETYFGVPLALSSEQPQTTSIPLKVRVDKHCDTDPVYMRVRYSFTVHINYAERLLIENKLGTIDGIHSQVPAFYFKGDFNPMEDAREAYFSFKWDPAVKEETIKQVLAALAAGYLEAAEMFTQRRFKTELCRLSQEQLKVTRQNFPFALELSISSSYPLPPPLPDLEADSIKQ